jgi:hypothetical protein
MPDLETLRQKLAKARRMVNEFQIAAANPAHSPEKQEILQHLTRSARSAQFSNCIHRFCATINSFIEISPRGLDFSTAINIAGTV